MDNEEKQNRKDITYASTDEELYLALCTKVLQKKKQGIKMTLRKLFEGYCWEGLKNDK